MNAIADELSPVAVARRHWELLGAALPGRASGLYLVGSAALEDFQPTVSDIDTITVVDQLFGQPESDALVQVHAAVAETFPDVRYDTTYVPQDWLSAPPGPDAAPPTPFSLDGVLHLGERSSEIHPVVWLELRQSVRVAGIPPDQLSISVDPSSAQAYVVNNLRTYWADEAKAARAAVAGRDPAVPVCDPEAVTWIALGAPRLAHFLETGRQTSKTEAGRWVADRYPRFADLAHRAIAARNTGQAHFTIADVALASDLIDLLVQEASADGWAVK